MALRVVSGDPRPEVRAAVIDECLWFTDPRVGGTMGDSEPDQGTEVQTFLDLAAGDTTGFNEGLRVGKFPPGYVRLDTAVTLPGGDRSECIIEGAGGAGGVRSGTVISCTTSPGADVDLFSIPARSWPATLKGVYFYGPYRGALTIGSDPSDCNALFTDGRVTLTDVGGQRWAIGHRFVNDHLRIYRPDWEANGFGMLMDDCINLGDFYMEAHTLTNNTKAGLGIATGAALLNAVLIQGHNGFQPFGVLSVDRGATGGDVRTQMIAGLTLTQSSFEYNRNGLICDDGHGRTVSGINWIGESEFGTFDSDEHHWAAKTDDAAIDVLQVSQLRMQNTSGWPKYDVSYGTKPWIKAEQILDVHMDLSGYLDEIAGSDPYRMFEYTGADATAVQNISIGSGAPSAPLMTAAVAGGTIAKYDVVGHHFETTVQTVGSSGIALGVAAHDCVAGEMCHYFTRGWSLTGAKVKNETGADILSGALLTPDFANAGCVKTATSSDVQIIGRAMRTFSDGTSSDVKLFGMP
jgi:hypothetical protein